MQQMQLVQGGQNLQQVTTTMGNQANAMTLGLKPGDATIQPQGANGLDGLSNTHLLDKSNT